MGNGSNHCLHGDEVGLFLVTQLFLLDRDQVLSLERIAATTGARGAHGVTQTNRALVGATRSKPLAELDCLRSFWIQDEAGAVEATERVAVEVAYHGRLFDDFTEFHE